MNTKQLRQKILDLAIKGKLVPQDPNDEPASKLLERIREEKEQLIKEGKLKRDKNESYIFVGDDKLHYEKFSDGSVVCIEDEIPFEIPESWAWCKLRTIGQYKKGPFGSALTKAIFVPKSNDTIKVYEQKNAIQKDANLGSYYITNEYYESNMKSFTVHPGEIIVSCAGTIGETYILPNDIEKGIIDQALMKISLTDYINVDYFLNYFDFILKKEALENSQGTAIKNIPPFDVLKEMYIAIPPINEQKRISETVETLLELVDSIESDKIDLSELIKQTKAKVLDLAIKGKLVQQDTNDEPADKLLEKIREEKEKLIKEGKLKRDKNETFIFKNSDDNSYYEQIDGETVCIDDDLPFEIPDSWRWCRFNNFSLYSTDYVANGSFASLNENVNIYKTPNYALLIKTQDFANNFTKDLTYIDKQSYEFLQKSKLFGGELMLSNIGASIGKAFIIPNLQRPMSIAPNSIIIKFLDNITTKYVYFIILSHFGQSILKGFTAGTAMPKFNKTQLRETLLPYPSYDEQKRIVYKIENIFSYLDNLESIIKGS